MNAGEQQLAGRLLVSLFESARIPGDDPRLVLLGRVFGGEGAEEPPLGVCPNGECGLPREEMLWHPEGDNRNCCPRCGTSLLRVRVKEREREKGGGVRMISRGGQLSPASNTGAHLAVEAAPMNYSPEGPARGAGARGEIVSDDGKEGEGVR